MDRRSFLHLSLAAPALAMTSTAAFAEWNPRRPVNVIVPYSAGGGTDSFGRALAESAEAALPVPMVIVNRPGSSGITGATEAAGARPDGSTFMMTSSGSLTLTYLLRHTDVDPFDSFIPVAQIGRLTTSLMVPMDSPYETLDDLVAAIQEAPGTLRWAHTGRGGFHHVAGQGFLNAAGLEAQDVPFSGGGNTRAAVIGGQVDFGMIGIQQAAGFANELRTLALVSDTRDAFATEVPTFAEQGYEVPLISSPIVVFAPLGTPDDVVTGMQDAIEEITQEQGFIDSMAERGNAPAFLPGADVATVLAALRDDAAPIVAGISEE
ncbi:Bug family tripartite tricarboxylate transporter substrate binding protein [Gymnodinialimonas ulvae]|uniref:Bug family tripartite tricarboxylate transporter substrate binding protein n=1 Tax=Gymnodinialimonas ulvae TaxID=3126504 RepID=UPI0030B1DF12